MQYLAKGQNIALASCCQTMDSVTLALQWADVTGSGGADVSVLLLGADGRVRDEGDFYFYNNPGDETSCVRLLGSSPTEAGAEDRITVDLEAIPPHVTRVIVAASRDTGTFGDLDALGLTLADGQGDRVLGFRIDDASSETAFIFGEIYLHSGQWKFRAVGQGYAAGLEALVTDFGVPVDNEADETGDDAAATSGRQDATGTVAEPPVSPEPVIVPGEATAPAAEPRPRRKVRTARRVQPKPVLPPLALADDDSWHGARLFPVSNSRNELEREVRATSVLLSVMAQVPEFGRRITAKFNAPAGRLETYTEVTFPHGEGTVRPDGIIRTSRAGRNWTALVETKTNGNPLKPEQVQAYVDVAVRRKYDAVITLSNDIALGDQHPVTVDGRKLKRVALRHLSWAEVTHEVHMLRHHHGVANPAHLWLLDEFLRFLRHDNSGCKGFDNMGPQWTKVRDAALAGTLRPGDKGAAQVAENWERLVTHLCMRLSGEYGAPVSPVSRGRRGRTSDERLKDVADALCEDHRLRAEITIPHFVGTMSIVANVTGNIEVSARVPAPDRKRELTKVRWIVGCLAEARQDVRVESVLEDDEKGPCELLRDFRHEPALLVPGRGSIRSFEITTQTRRGGGRGSEETGFIRSVDRAVDEFRTHVLTAVREPKARSAEDDD